MITFSDVAASRSEARGRINVGDEHFDLWFAVTGAPVEASPEAFTLAALPVAMARGLAIRAPAALTSSFVEGLRRWQTVFSTWFPDRLAAVDVQCAVRRPRRPARRRACFFSGGVDSFFTALRHSDDIDALVFVYGFDVPREALPDLRRSVTAGVRAAAAELGKPLVEVETNLHDFSDAMGLPWGTTYHGIALAAVAHVLGPAFGEVLVGATHSYADMFPWGSNPLSDPMLSSDRVRLSHDGADADRVQKTVAVAESDAALRHLRVCWENVDGTYNCGQCPKCIRTQIALRIAGRLEACQTLPAEIDLDAVRSMPLRDLNTIAFVAELVHHLRELGTEPELLAACEDDLRNHDPASVRWGTTGWASTLPLIWERHVDSEG